jgi:transglutaminase-like putative cysteine protease
MTDNLSEYLKEDNIFDFNHPRIQKIVNELELDGLSDKEIAIKLFYYVRDKITYSVKIDSFDFSTFKASETLDSTHSYCIPKAIALSSLARAVGIPSKIHFVDFINHRLSPEVEELWQTKVMAGHCFSELYIDGKWVKATPALDIRTSNKHGFKLVEFNGEENAMLHKTDLNGNLHAEYIKDHDTYSYFPFELVMNIFKENYDMDRMSEILSNGKEIPSFQ